MWPGVRVTLSLRDTMFLVYGNISNFASHTFLKLVTQNKEHWMSPAVLPSRQCLKELSHFDFALVQTGKYSHKTVVWGMPLQGMWPLKMDQSE